MAKKKKTEESLKYLQMPLPSGGKYSKMTKVTFGGLNKRYNIDSGEMSMENNISTKEYPYLTPSERKTGVYSPYDEPIGLYAFDDFLIVVYIENNTVKVDYIKDIATEDEIVHTGVIKNSVKLGDADTQRSVVQFNVYDTPTDPLTGQYVKKLLLFPDKVSMYMNIVKAEYDYETLQANATKENATDEEKEAFSDALSASDTSVMYYYGNKANRRYYTIGFEKKVEGDEGYNKDKDSYKRVLYKKSECKQQDEKGKEETITLNGAFFCDGMEVTVREYRNETPEVDASGATIYPPPDTADHNCYYRNAADNDIYRWCEYETCKRLDEWGLDKNLNDDGELIDETANKDGFILDGENYVKDGGKEKGWKVSVPPAVPSLKYVTVHLSRVFGVDNDRVYASGYNDYANWNLDTAGEYNEANSWCSPSQSNTKAGGEFTGITTFQNHVVCFKHDFMHEIYNTKNPFRLQDIYAEGAIDNRTIQDVDGKLIFVSEDDVKVYTGSNPRIIGYNLNMPKFTYAVSGTDNRNYYLYCEEDIYRIEDADGNVCCEDDEYCDACKAKIHLYVYDTFTDMWSEQDIDKKVINFAHNKDGMYMLCANGKIYQMDTEDYDHNWSFETDLVTNKTVDIKHIKKLQMLAEVSEGSDMEVYILYDDEEFDENSSHLVWSSKDRYGRLPIRVKPRKTANYGFKLHIRGKGYVKLYELEIFVEQGGDMYV